jgi:DNA polymerase alpha-associated DNA helicase A
MQLPPTVLSLDAERKKQDKQKAKASPPKPKGKKEEEKKEDVTEAVASEADEDDEEEEGDDDEIDDEEEDAKPTTEAPAEALVNLDIRSKPKKPRRKREAILVPPRTLEVTLFERLEKMYGSRVKRMLKVQYR